MLEPERKLLGNPLNPNQMVIEDWNVLPGIRPVLAKRIVHNRQLNDVFTFFQTLLGIPILEK